MITQTSPSLHVACITLNRPQSLNALNLELLKSFRNILKQVGQDDSIRVLIIGGEGEKAFCAGADLKERSDMTYDETRNFVALISGVMNAVEGLPMPTIAAMNGVAFGGGLELALACDLRVAAPHCVMGLTECALGIIPGAGGTQRLPRLIGLGRAKEMIFSAKRVSAQEAFRLGLVERVARDESAFELALGLAKQMANNAPLSLRAAKSAIVNGYDLPLDNGLALELECYERILYSQDRIEGLKAFTQKRKPEFKGV